jgi:hypothetical protein
VTHGRKPKYFEMDGCNTSILCSLYCIVAVNTRIFDIEKLTGNDQYRTREVAARPALAALASGCNRARSVVRAIIPPLRSFVRKAGVRTDQPDKSPWWRFKPALLPALIRSNKLLAAQCSIFPAGRAQPPWTNKLKPSTSAPVKTSP